MQIVIGGLLLSLTVCWKGKEVSELLKAIVGKKRKPSIKIKSILKAIASLIVSIMIIAIVIEPFVGGVATIEIMAPEKNKFPTVLENLRVRVAPVGLLGEAGGEQRVVEKFDRKGLAIIHVRFATFQSRIDIRVYDVTNPGDTVSVENAYVSPFVRRQLCALKVNM